MSRRVCITGLGVVSPVGNDVRTFWASLLAGKSGVTFIDRFSTEKLRSDIAAMVRELDASRVLDEKERGLHGRVTQMLLLAGDEAVTQAGLPPEMGERVGVLLGTGQGPVDVIDETFAHVAQKGIRTVSPFFIPTAMPNAASALLSIKRSFLGPSFTLASACATGVHAMAVGALMIAGGEADAMVVGGGEAAILPACVAGFGNARALARAFQGDPTRSSRPYDVDRQGFVMGEGAGAMVLEAEESARARGAEIIAYLDGWGMSSDGENIVRPHPEGRGVSMAIKAALRRSGVAAGDIGYINPHATSTPQGDVAEYKGLCDALGKSVHETPLSATKSLIGHLLGGAGIVEAIATVCTLRDGEAHPSLNLDRKDEVFDLRIVTERTKVAARAALKTSAGFGGHNVALVLTR